MLANRLAQKIMSEVPDVVMNGDPEERYPGKALTSETDLSQIPQHEKFASPSTNA